MSLQLRTVGLSRTDDSFELAIAVCVAVYGVDSDQALAATIGPLVEVPVLLLLTEVSLLFQRRLHWWNGEAETGDAEASLPEERSSVTEKEAEDIK